MRYFRLTTSSDKKEVGKIPQSEDGYLGDIQKDFISWESKIDFDFKLPKPNIEKNAKLVSLLDVAFIYSYIFLVIDDRLLNLLKDFHIGNYQFWKICTSHNGKLINDKYNLFTISDTKQSKYIDFKNSEFLIGQLGDWRDPSIREPVIINNYAHYLELKNRFKKDKNKKRLRYTKIILDLSNAKEDMFRIVNAPPGGYFVSEKLKNAIQENDFTGMEFVELNDLDKVEVFY